LTETDGKIQSNQASDSASAAVSARLKWTVAAIVFLLAAAMGLKAWDEHQRADANLLLTLQAEAEALAGRVAGRADTVETAIRLVADNHASRSAIASATPGVDAVMSLKDAQQAPEGSRLEAAALTAEHLIRSGQRAGLSELGDVVLVTGTARDAVIALAPAGTWLPSTVRDHQISLVSSGALQVVAGDPVPRPASGLTPTRQARFLSDGGLKRSALACSPVSGEGLAVCSTTRADVLTRDDFVSLLIFALLLAAPVLAIAGLMGRLSKHQAETIVEAARDEQADRIMATVMRSARAGYWEWTPDQASVFLSEASSELLGLEGLQTIPLESLTMQVHPDHRVRVREALDKSRTIGWLQIGFVTAHPPLRWIEMRGSSTDTESGALFGGIMLDITDRKQAEDRVKAAERRLRGALEGFTGPFALWDHHKRLLYWNKAFATDFDLTDTLRAGMAHDTVTIARTGSVRAERPSEEDPDTLLVCLQSGRWLKLVERPSGDGGLITVGIDVTENIGIEEELRRQKERMQKTMQELASSERLAGDLAKNLADEKARAENAASSKSAFLANMSHELRTPLNAINGFSEIIAHELYGPLGDQRYKGYAQDILASGQHLLDMINDILDMAKIEAGKMTINPQPIDPVDPVDAAVRMIRRKASDKDIEIMLDVQPGLPEIDADHRAIRQMVLNLVANAIKFTNPGGKITVSVQQYGPDIKVSVTDTGIGIPAVDLPRLSQPFEQATGTHDRNYEGTGLGLALTKSFAEMHGGELTISSIEGEGTTVAFTLPIIGPGEMEDAA